MEDSNQIDGSKKEWLTERRTDTQNGQTNEMVTGPEEKIKARKLIESSSESSEEEDPNEPGTSDPGPKRGRPRKPEHLKKKYIPVKLRKNTDGEASKPKIVKPKKFKLPKVPKKMPEKEEREASAPEASLGMETPPSYVFPTSRQVAMHTSRMEVFAEPGMQPKVAGPSQGNIQPVQEAPIQALEELDELQIEQLVGVAALHRPGSEEFMAAFKQFEKQFFSNNNTDLVVRVDRADMTTLHNLFNVQEKVILVPADKIDELGMSLPSNGLNFKNVGNHCFKNPQKIDVIDSRTGETHESTVGDVYHHVIHGGTENFILNCLSFEISHVQYGKFFCAPYFVRQNSMVAYIDQDLEEKSHAFETKLNQIDGDQRAEIETNKMEAEKYQKYIPRYEKYLILSQPGAFTDLHIDLAGSAVFYYVAEGQKILYVAPPTRENLELYKHLEKDRGVVWKCGADVLRRFQRVVVNKGETIFMPSGFLHFVYTPEKSLVFGGNFLNKKYIPLHFTLTHMEEHCLKFKNLTRNQLFKNFYEFMFIWLRDYYLRDVEKRRDLLKNSSCRATGMALLHGLELKSASGLFFASSQKNDLLKRLRKVLGVKPDPVKKAQRMEEAKHYDNIDFSYIKIQ